MYPDHNGSDLVLKFNHSSEDNSANNLVGCGVKHLQFSSFLQIWLAIILSIFYFFYYIVLFIGSYFTPQYYFVRYSIIQHYKLISHPYNDGWIIIIIILLFYLASYFIILRCLRDYATLVIHIFHVLQSLC